MERLVVIRPESAGYCASQCFFPFSTGHIGCRNVGNKVCRQSAVGAAFCSYHLYGLLKKLHRSINLKLGNDSLLSL